MTEPTFAWRLTADVPAAIASIAIRGPRACELAQYHLRSADGPLHLDTDRDIGRIRFATWELTVPDSAHATEQSIVSEQVVACRTLHDTVEIHCHGGTAVSRAILSDLQRSGCTMGAPLDWPSELKCGLALAAQQDLLKSTTDRTAAILLDQMQGALRCALEALLNELNQGGLAAAERHIGELLERSVLGLHLVHPWQIVLAGPPNVGKSSLMNALVGTRQAIVHHEPGTTRDWLEAGGAIDGWPVIFTDTAGIRSTQDPIEQAGVQRSRQRLQMADLAVLVVDALHGWTDEHEQLLKLIRVPPLVAWNKVDVAFPAAPPTVHYEDSELDCILTSALGEPGTADLLSAISRRLLPMSPAVGVAVPFRAEQVERLVDCQRLVQTQKCAEARQLVLQWLSENNY